jgi:hypothetical protein
LNLREQLRALLFAMDELNHANNDEPTSCPHRYLIHKLWPYNPNGLGEDNVRVLIKEIRGEIDRVLGGLIAGSDPALAGFTIRGEGERSFLRTAMNEALPDEVSLAITRLTEGHVKVQEPKIAGYRLVKHPAVSIASMINNDRSMKTVAAEPAAAAKRPRSRSAARPGGQA